MINRKNGFGKAKKRPLYSGVGLFYAFFSVLVLPFSALAQNIAIPDPAQIPPVATQPLAPPPSSFAPPAAAPQALQSLPAVTAPPAASAAQQTPIPSLEAPFVPGDVRYNTRHAGVDKPVLQQTPMPSSPLFAEQDHEVIMENHQAIRSRKQQIQERTAHIPNDARRVRYRPVQNDPRVDPLDKGYEDWLQGIRSEQTSRADIDYDYEDFIKGISVLLFSLGEKQLSLESKEVLDNIPADSLSDPMRSMELKNPVGIAYGDTDDPFPPLPETVDETVGVDVNLDIAVKSASPTTNGQLEMGYDALTTGQINGAISIYKDVLAHEPENKQALFGLATSYHRNGQLEDAREQYIALLNLEPGNWPAMNNFLVLIGEEAPEDAIKELRRLEQINPEFSPIPAQMGMIYLRLNQVDNAIKYFGRAIVLAPDNLGYRYNLAVVLDHSGYKTQAARLYSQLLEAEANGKTLPESRQRIADRLAYINATKRVQ